MYEIKYLYTKCVVLQILQVKVIKALDVAEELVLQDLSFISGDLLLQVLFRLGCLAVYLFIGVL